MPLRLLPLKSSHCALHNEFQQSRCVRKTATFPSSTPRVPSSALLFDLEVPFLRFHSFSSFSLSVLELVHVRLYFSLSLLLTSRYIPIIFPLFHRPGTTASPRDEDVPRGRGVRLNIDYARFETRVMREADRVNPACTTT